MLSINAAHCVCASETTTQPGITTNDRVRQTQRVAQINANHLVFEEVLFAGAACIAVLSLFSSANSAQSGAVRVMPRTLPKYIRVYSCLFVVRMNTFVP